MSRNGGGTCELCVGVHTSHGICHTVGSRTCCHVIRVKSTACAAAGCYGEVLLAFLYAFFLVCTCNRMLETGRVGGVTGDGNVYALFPHDRNALCYVVSAVAVYFCTRALRICGVAFAENFLNFACVVVHLCLNISKAVDTGDDLCSVFSETV